MRRVAALIILSGMAAAALAQQPRRDPGTAAWERGDFATAVQLWTAPANRGEAEAQFNLGQAHRLGRGVGEDLAKARDWYSRAAQQGHPGAETALGLLLFQMGEREAAMPRLLNAANRGDARALYVYGTALFNGDLVPRDWPRAFAMMHRAAQAGLAPAEESLRLMERHIPAEQRREGMTIATRMAGTAPAPLRRTVADAAATQRNVTATVRRTAAAPPALPAPRPAPAAPIAAAAGGRWKVQLGAFGAEAGAQRLWGEVRRLPEFGAAQPFYVPSGKVVRLQAGPFASKADGDRACRAATRAGHGCFVLTTG